ncbi:MAG: glycerate kinase, partial [Schwartzia sp.]|nr:glycerate kinase [Schwartzia sp. (in: firmicutes)]
VVFTGEGRLDSQSLMGKAVGGIAQRAKEAGIPVICVAGAVSNDIDEIYRSGITAAFSINQEPLPFSEAAGKTRENLARTMDNIFRLLNWRSKDPPNDVTLEEFKKALADADINGQQLKEEL